MSPNYSLLFVLFCFGLTQSAKAQYNPNYQLDKVDRYEGKIVKKDKVWWFDSGIGFVGEAMGYQASFNYQINDRVMVATGYDRADYFSDKPEEWKVSNSVSIDGGFMMRGRSWIGYFTIGPSYTWGNKTEQPKVGEVMTFNQTNLKFKAGLIARKYHVGISPFVHFNVTNTISGITLNIIFGNNIKN